MKTPYLKLKYEINIEKKYLTNAKNLKLVIDYYLKKKCFSNYTSYFQYKFCFLSSINLLNSIFKKIKLKKWIFGPLNKPLNRIEFWIIFIYITDKRIKHKIRADKKYIV